MKACIIVHWSVCIFIGRDIPIVSYTHTVIESCSDFYFYVVQLICTTSTSTRLSVWCLEHSWLFVYNYMCPFLFTFVLLLLINKRNCLNLDVVHWKLYADLSPALGLHSCNTCNFVCWMFIAKTSFHCQFHRYLVPPTTWVSAQLESRELLSICLKKLKGLDKVGPYASLWLALMIWSGLLFFERKLVRYHITN